MTQSLAITVPYLSEFVCDFDYIEQPKEIICTIPDSVIEDIFEGLIRPRDYRHKLKVFYFAIERIHAGNTCATWSRCIREFIDQYAPIENQTIDKALDELNISKINQLMKSFSKEIKDDDDIKVYMILSAKRTEWIQKHNLSAKIM